MPITPGGSEHIKGYKKLALLHDLAAGLEPIALIAARYERAESTIYAFKKRHAAEIDAIRAETENEFASLWVAKKANRIAEYQDDIETLSEAEGDPQSIAQKHKALRAVAEELGQLTTRAEIQASVAYRVEGVDLDTMK